jgi:putative N6-adenine-specific DNA methylase
VETFFASCPRGLEQLLAEDLLRPVRAASKQIFRRRAFRADWTVCYRANLDSRIATRILWRVAQAPYATEDDIYRLALETPWPQLVPAEQTIRVDVTPPEKPLKSIDFVTLRIKDAVCDRFRRDAGTRPSVDTRQPDVRVHGFISSERMHAVSRYLGRTAVSARFSPEDRGCAAEGEPGRRHPAPQRLAAGYRAARPDVRQRHLSARGGADRARHGAGGRREFRFPAPASVSAGAWKKLLDCRTSRGEKRRLRPGSSAATSRRSPCARRWPTSIAPDCCRRSRLSTGDLLEIEAPAEHGIMVSNPPYGERVSDHDELAEFYPCSAVP